MRSATRGATEDFPEDVDALERGLAAVENADAPLVCVVEAYPPLMGVTAAARRRLRDRLDQTPEHLASLPERSDRMLIAPLVVCLALRGAPAAERAAHAAQRPRLGRRAGHELGARALVRHRLGTCSARRRRSPSTSPDGSPGGAPLRLARRRPQRAGGMRRDPVLVTAPGAPCGPRRPADNPTRSRSSTASTPGFGLLVERAVIPMGVRAVRVEPERGMP
ncbi:MAG: hypothetical protein ACRDYA_12985 [Egibacteraceae bacterium]